MNYLKIFLESNIRNLKTWILKSIESLMEATLENENAIPVPY